MIKGKTVGDLIKYLETKDPKTAIGIIYDGNYEVLNVFDNNGVLAFSNHKLTTEYEDAKIEFTTKD